MATREREHMEDMDEDDDRDEELEQLLVCLDMLRGSSALLRQHKAGLAGLLPSRGWKARRALERLVADLTDVLSSTSGSTTAAGRQQQEGGAGGREEPARHRLSVAESGVKRARGGQAAQARSAEQQGHQHQQQQGPQESSSSCVCADPLGLAEVVEHVMSFVEGREMLGRLSRVCRLWRRVSEGERLCLPMVQKHMPCALLGGEESLHARLGGSARRCLQVHNASRTSRMVIPTGDYLREREVVLLTEVLYRGRLLSAMSGRPDGGICSGRGETYLYIGDGVEQSEVFSAASLGFDGIRTTFKCTTFNFGGVYVRFLAMDKTTGVVASLWQGRFEHDGQLPEYLEGMFHFTSKAEPVTSMSYNGPPLHAQVDMYIELAGGSLDDDEDVQSIHLDRERQWRISGSPGLALMGQPGVYGERFIRTRLAEEAMAAKQQGK